MLCHSCIDNCIHTYAGEELRAECARQMEAPRRPYEQPAAEIAVQTVTDWLSACPGAMDRVIFAVLSDRSREIYEKVLG